jgi:hypothetical protein
MYYATINKEGETIETFQTDDPYKVQPREDYHQIIKCDPGADYYITNRYNSIYELLNIPF